MCCAVRHCRTTRWSKAPGESYRGHWSRPLEFTLAIHSEWRSHNLTQTQTAATGSRAFSASLCIAKRSGSKRQGGAIFELLRTAPQNSELVATIREFLSRPIDSNVRIGVLNALGNPGTKHIRLIALVTESLENPDPNTRLTAIQALTRIGNDALRQAEAPLSRLATDPTRGRAGECQTSHKTTTHHSETLIFVPAQWFDSTLPQL